ncbi:MAG: hypothetical protein ACOCRO_10690, partial [Halanaerobiales bacterium]
FSVGDEVDVKIHRLTDIGIKVVINDKYFALVYEEDIYKNYEVGQETKGYIKNIRDDNKIDVTLRKAGYGRIEDAKQTILDKLKKEDGFLALNDNSSPDEIKKKLEMSKGTFKKAIGGLYKEEIINITDKGIELRYNN